MSIQHPIQLVAKRTGLSAHVIRAWEKRYCAVAPGRTDSNRRLYNDEEIERLRILGLLTQGGHRIGDIAHIPTGELRELLTNDTRGIGPRSADSAEFDVAAEIEEAIMATRRMNSAALVSILDRSARALGQRGMLEQFVSPLARRIGELWADGNLTAAHEHFASGELRLFLLRGSRAYAENAGAPLILITTPAGQLHELGASIVAASARDLGWRVAYLGPNLPAADIASAAESNGARIVALSIVYPPDDASLPAELEMLRRLVPNEIEIIAGGSAAEAYSDVLESTGIKAMNDLTDLARHLVSARMPPGR